MRLTLRTLLAYLDDTLEPTEASEIGKKVAENPQALELMDRIKKTMRKRSLTPPTSTKGGDSADANTVAQYLSDSLPSEQVANFDKVCLEHDANLAEVAACHQILTLLQAEQIRIPPSTRRRMYDLADAPMALPNRKPARAVSLTTVYDETSPIDASSDAAYLMGLSAMSRKESTRARIGRVLLGATLLVIFVASVVMVWPQSPQQGRDLARVVVDSASMANASPSKQIDEPKRSDTKTEVAPLPVEKMPTKPPAETPPGATPPVTPTTPMPVPDNVAGKELRVVPPIDKQKTVLGVIEKKEPVPVLLRLQTTDEKPLLIPIEDFVIRSTDRYTVFPGYRPVFRFQNEITVECWGNLPSLSANDIAPTNEVSFMPTFPQPGVDVDLSLYAGRFYIQSKKAKPTAVRLRIGSLVWDMVFANDMTEIAVEVGPSLATGPGALRSEQKGSLYIMQGEVSLYTTRQTKETLLRNESAYWDSVTNLTTIKRDAKAGLATPPYWSKVQIPADATRAKDTYQIINDFSANVMSTGNLPANIAELYQDKEPGAKPKQILSSQIAVYNYGVLGDLNALTDALNDNKRYWVRTFAIVALRQLLANDPNRLNEFRNILLNKTRLTEEYVDEIVRLLPEMGPQQRQNPEMLDKLLGDINLENDAMLPVRELAYSHLISYLNSADPKDRELFFDTAAPVEARKPIILLWGKKIETLKTGFAKTPAVPAP